MQPGLHPANLTTKVSSLKTATDTPGSSDFVDDTFRSGVLLAITGTFLFALKSIFIKLAYGAGADATLLLTLRMGMSLPFYLVVLLVLRRGKDRVRLPVRHMVKAIMLGFLGYYLASYLDLCGLQYISAQLERLTLFTYPAIIAILAWMFLGERLGVRVLAAIGLSYVGVWLMYGQEKGMADATLSDSSNTMRGVVLVIGAAFSFSFYVLFAKPTMQQIGSREFTSLAMVGSTVFTLVHYFLVHDASDLLEADRSVYGYGMILAFACTLIPSFMINEAIVRIGATRTSVIGSVGPVLTMGLAIFVLAEPSSVQHFAGMCVAVLGVSLVAKR